MKHDPYMIICWNRDCIILFLLCTRSCSNCHITYITFCFFCFFVLFTEICYILRPVHAVGEFHLRSFFRSAVPMIQNLSMFQWSVIIRSNHIFHRNPVSLCVGFSISLRIQCTLRKFFRYLCLYNDRITIFLHIRHFFLYGFICVKAYKIICISICFINIQTGEILISFFSVF